MKRGGQALGLWEWDGGHRIWENGELSMGEGSGEGAIEMKKKCGQGKGNQSLRAS